MKFWTSLEEQRAVSLRRSEMKVAAIARRLGRSRQSVSQKLNELHIVLEPEKRMRRKHGELLRVVSRALLAGGTVVEVATRFSLCDSYVSRVRKRLGIPPATPQERLSRSWVFRFASGQKPPNRWSKKEKGHD